MQVHFVRKAHVILVSLLTIAASFSHRGTIGPSGFEIITRSPYVPAAFYNFRQYNDGRLEHPKGSKQASPQNYKKNHELFTEEVFVKSNDKPKYKEVHFKDGPNSMIMDVKMLPHYHHGKGDNELYNVDLSKLVQQLTATTSDEFLPSKVLTMKIQQKTKSKQNVNFNGIVNLPTFFSSGRDNVDYGYTLDSAGSPIVEDQVNSLSRFGKDDVDSKITFMDPDMISHDGTYKNPTDTEPMEINEKMEFLSTTESYDPIVFEDSNLFDRNQVPPAVVASLLGG